MCDANHTNTVLSAVVLKVGCLNFAMFEIWPFTLLLAIPMIQAPYFFYKFSPNLLNGRIDEERARSKQSL